MRVRSLLVLSVVAVLYAASAAQASDIFQYVFNQSAYYAAAGAPVAVTVSLQESGGGSLLATTGLVGIGVGVTWDQNAPANPAAVTSAANIAVAPGFPQVWGTFIDVPDNWDPDYITTTQSAGLSAAIQASANPILVKATGSGPVYTVALGTFTFTAGSTPGTTTVRATDVSSEDDNVLGLYPNSTVLDALIADGTCTITTTPEPSTLVLSCIAALGFLGLRLRRKAA